MTVFQAPVRFFLGATTPQGFVGFAEELYDPSDGWQAYLIKSGPGTGKSTLMRRVYDRMTALSVETEAFCCSSDPSSLDGVVVPALRMCLLDATAPHVVEPKFWGAVEQLVPLSICSDEALLHRQSAEIQQVTEENRALHAQCRRYVTAAGALLRENYRLGEAALDKDKVQRTARRIARQELEAAGGTGRLQRRFLSALTPEGLLLFQETLQALCPRIYAIEDDYGASASLLLSEIAAYARERDVAGILCPSPLAPEQGPEHLLFPSVGVGFTTSSPLHRADYPVFRRIHATRFSDVDVLRAKRQTAAFHRRAVGELLAQAQTLSAEAKAVHDRMEAFSAAAMDWDAAQAMGDTVVQKFQAAAERLLS